MNFREASALICVHGDEVLTDMASMSRGLVRAVAGENASFEDLEILTLAISQEVDRRQLEAELQEASSTFGERVSIDGEVYVRHHEGRVGYHSLCGTLRVTRSTYRKTGVHNGP